MFISVEVLQKQELKFDERIPPAALDLGAEISPRGPLKAEGQAELVEEHEGDRRILDIRLRGKYAVPVAVECARCLAPVEQELKGEFDLLYRPLGAVARPAESSISKAETEIGFYAGQGLALEQAMSEQVLLEAPLRWLCRPDCKGICPQCGRNLNAEKCNCRPPRNLERWAGLEQLRGKLH